MENTKPERHLYPLYDRAGSRLRTDESTAVILMAPMAQVRPLMIPHYILRDWTEEFPHLRYQYSQNPYGLAAATRLFQCLVGALDD